MLYNFAHLMAVDYEAKLSLNHDPCCLSPKYEQVYTILFFICAITKNRICSVFMYNKIVPIEKKTEYDCR